MDGIVTMAPRSVQLAEIIRQEITQGKIKPGHRLLSIRAMAQRFGDTHQVSRSAFDILAREGLIKSNLGRSGSYVAEVKKTLISQTVLSIIETKQENHAQFKGEIPEMLVREGYMSSIYEISSSIMEKEKIMIMTNEIKPGRASDLFMKGCIKALDEAGLKPAASCNNEVREVAEQIEDS